MSFEKQRGVTLLELTMAIGIIAIIVVGAIAFFNSANESNRSLTASRNISALAASIRNQYAAQGDYANIENLAVKLGNAFPRDMNGGPGDEIAHPWRNDGITVSPFTILFADDAFSIQLDDVPQGACVDIGSKLFNDFDDVDIGGPVLEVLDVANGCADPVSNTMIFTAR